MKKTKKSTRKRSRKGGRMAYRDKLYERAAGGKKSKSKKSTRKESRKKRGGRWGATRTMDEPHWYPAAEIKKQKSQ